jgi:uncharacterized repeat protein (TIGR04138 family)
MHEAGFDEAVDAICAKDARYHREAYLFLREALDFTQKTIGKDQRGRIRHVSGQELLQGIRQFASEKFGPMAMMLFEEWGVRHCQDFGEIVFNMVEANLLAKTEQDSRADFEGGYSFFDAFRKPYLPPSRQASPAPEPKPTGA